jgi:hypothetical protein
METIPISFKDLKETKKGKEGEDKVASFLKKIGFLVYRAPDEPHPFDMFCVKAETKEIYFLDVKTKPPLRLYPDWTGCDTKDYELYKEYKYLYNINFYLIFVDENQIYGNTLDNLGEPMYVPNTNKKQVCWNIEKMQIFDNGEIYK